MLYSILTNWLEIFLQFPSVFSPFSVLFFNVQWNKPTWKIKETQKFLLIPCENIMHSMFTCAKFMDVMKKDTTSCKILKSIALYFYAFIIDSKITTTTHSSHTYMCNIFSVLLQCLAHSTYTVTAWIHINSQMQKTFLPFPPFYQTPT